MEKNAKNAVGYFQHTPSGCSWYRIEHPMEALKKAGITVHALPINEDIDNKIIDSLMSVIFYGAVPFSFEPVVKFLKEKGIKIVYDMDDALNLIDASNPFFHSVKRDVGSVQQLLDYADEVTTATPALATYVKTHYDFKGKVTVIPNSYSQEEWPTPIERDAETSIGFAGASPHVSDLIDIIPTIKVLQEKYNIKFYIMGFGQEDYISWFKQYRYIAQPEATKELRILDALLSEIEFEWVPFVNYKDFPKKLNELALDIGICPLRDTPFNNNRSASKAMEYNLTGALVLASDTISYQTDPTSILVKDGAWEEQLEFYILNKEIASKVHHEHMNWIYKNRNIDNKVDLLKSVYVV